MTTLCRHLGARSRVGTSGCALAARLTEQPGVTVLLLETGTRSVFGFCLATSLNGYLAESHFLSAAAPPRTVYSTITKAL